MNIKEVVRRNRHILKKDERRHQALQIRKNKRDEVLSKKRAIGRNRNPPFLVCVVPLNAQLDVQSALVILKTCSEGATVSHSTNGILHLALVFIFFTIYFTYICSFICDFIIKIHIICFFQLTKLQATLFICMPGNK